MATIQLHVQDDFIQQLGVGAVRQLLEEELTYQRFRLTENRIQSAMHEAQDVNWEEEFENARQKAYEEYLQKRQAAL
ncbi:hypothetical protein [Spirosoma rigui]|uniref:hypothetical protein n=1 Tax=Spirosoma rigui TaxID=564064 RepID=UPI0009AF5752|nr:hypothetical protein [Spirosoma rigui]